MHDVAKHDDSKGQYFWVWGALLVLTGVEVWLGYKQVFEPVRMLEVLLVLSDQVGVDHCLLHAPEV
jgi:hypothetical protein